MQAPGFSRGLLTQTRSARVSSDRGRRRITACGWSGSMAIREESSAQLMPIPELPGDEPWHLYRRAQVGRHHSNLAALIVKSADQAVDSSDFARWHATTIGAESV